MARFPNTIGFQKKLKIILPEYSLIDEQNFTWQKPIEVLCPKHGPFKKYANDLLKGSKCPKCSGWSRTTKTFVAEAIKVHGNKYSYKESEYTKSGSKLNITCPEHGNFLQKAISHLRGHGCPECATGYKKTTESFIEMAKKIHNEKYDYKKVRYISMQDPVEINCKRHGTFNQVPRDHLAGCGCPICGGTKKLSGTEFIQKAEKIHSKKFSYSAGIYKGAFEKMKITCPVHGDFWQRPNTHLNGSGCPSCAKTGFNPEKPAVLYYLLDKETGLYKIGVTNLTLQKRFGKIFCSKRAIALMEQHFENGQDAYLAEQEILTAFSHKKCVNESWPDEKGGKTEFFTEDILKLDKGES